MSRTKLVKGQVVPLTADEEARADAREARDLERLRARKIEENRDVAGEQISAALGAAPGMSTLLKQMNMLADAVDLLATEMGDSLSESAAQQIAGLRAARHKIEAARAAENALAALLREAGTDENLLVQERRAQIAAVNASDL